MAGLLDFIGTPEGQGLLSAAFGGLAGARRGAPLNSIGIAGLSGLQGYQNAQQQGVMNQYRDLQSKKIEADLAQKQAAQDFFQGGSAPQLGQVPTGVFQQPASGAPATGSAPTAPQPTGPTMSQDMLRRMLMSGNPYLVDMAKNVTGGLRDLAPVTSAAGSFTIDPVTNERRYLPKIAEGMSLDDQGNAVNLPGYVQSNAQAKGAEAAAVEWAKYPYVVGADRAKQQTAAGLDLVQGFDVNGNPVFTTRGNVVSGAGSAVRPDMTPGQKAAASGATSFANNIARSAADAIDASRAGAQSASGTLQNVQQIRSGMNNILTGPLANQRLTLLQVGQMMDVNGQDDVERLQNTRAAIQALSRQELSAAAQMKGQGQITESERAILRRAEAGDISDFSKPELDTLLGVLERTANYRIESHSALMDRVNAGATPNQIMDFRHQPPQQQTRPQSRTLNTLPQNAAAGMRVRDTATGKVLKFNGRVWQAE